MCIYDNLDKLPNYKLVENLAKYMIHYSEILLFESYWIDVKFTGRSNHLFKDCQAMQGRKPAGV